MFYLYHKDVLHSEIANESVSLLLCQLRDQVKTKKLPVTNGNNFFTILPHIYLSDVREVWSSNLGKTKSYTSLQTVRHRLSISLISSIALALHNRGAPPNILRTELWMKP